MEIGVIYQLKGLTALVLGTCLLQFSCSSSPEKETLEKGREVKPPKEVSPPENGETWDHVSPDKKKQTKYRSGKKMYEACFDQKGKISNRVFPEVLDSFLYEDKYYLKIVLPFPLEGEIEFDNNKGKPLYATEVDSRVFQLSVHEVLDVEDFVLKMNYIPAPKDTLLAWEDELELKIVPQY